MPRPPARARRVDPPQARARTRPLDPRDEREPLEQSAIWLEPSAIRPMYRPARLVAGRKPLDRPREAVHRRERGAEVVAGKRDDLREIAIFRHARRRSSSSWPTRTALPTTISRPPHRKCGSASPAPASRACTRRSGCGTATPRSSSSPRSTAPSTSIPRRKACTCRASPSCSRRRSTRSSIEEAFLVEDLADHIARHILERQDALRAEVRIVAPYPVERTTPVTGAHPGADLDHRVGRGLRRGVRRLVGVEATGSTRARARRGSSARARASASSRPGFGQDDTERIFQLVPLATHYQRGRGTLMLGPQLNVNAERLAQIVEESMSSPGLRAAGAA